MTLCGQSCRLQCLFCQWAVVKGRTPSSCESRRQIWRSVGRPHHAPRTTAVFVVDLTRGPGMPTDSDSRPPACVRVGRQPAGRRSWVLQKPRHSGRKCRKFGKVGARRDVRGGSSHLKPDHTLFLDVPTYLHRYHAIPVPMGKRCSVVWCAFPHTCTDSSRPSVFATTGPLRPRR